MSKTKVIPFRVDEETYNFLKEYSKKYNRPISGLMRGMANTFVQNMKYIEHDAVITYRRLTGLT